MISAPQFAIRLVGVASIVSILLGLSTLVGWLFDVPRLTSVMAGGASMKANTAVCFVLLGFSLLFESRPSPNQMLRRLGRIFAAIVVVLALLTLAQDIFSIDLHVDQLFIQSSVESNRHTGAARMAPMTALNFVLLGTSIAIIDASHHIWTRMSQRLGLAALAVSYIAITGYAYDVHALYTVEGYSSMAVHTAIGFGVLSLGVLASRPDRGIVAVVLQRNEIGTSVRFLLPFIVIVPFVTGWLRLEGQRAGFFGTEFGVALLVTVCTGILVVVTLSRSKAQSIADAARERSLEDERFVYKIGEVLRVATNSKQVLVEIPGALGEYLGVARCFFNQIDLKNDWSTIEQDYHRESSSLVGRIPLASFGAKTIEELLAANVVVINDSRADPRSAPYFKSAYEPRGLLAQIVIPLQRNGDWAASLVIADNRPRVWDERELLLAQSIAEKSWLWFERLRALEEILRSEQEVAATTRRAEEQLRLVIEAATIGMIMVDRSGVIVLLNTQIEKTFGYRRDELFGRPIEQLIPGHLTRSHAQYRTHFFAAPQSRAMGAGRDLFGRRKDGSEIPIEIGLNPFRTLDGDFVLASVVDITERKKSERERVQLLEELQSANAGLEEHIRARTAELTKALLERGTLLKEVHHRVKNNLQIISSLINMQLDQISDIGARSALTECQLRVKAIALIHTKLYQTQDLSSVPFAEYLRSLSDTIFSATGAPADIEVELLLESLTLSIEQAVPCGLLLNELLTNAIKHAFPNGGYGLIRIQFRRCSSTHAQLSVQDNGIGLGPNFDPASSSSLGLQLVTMLVEQLEGKLEFLQVNGTHFTATFPLQSAFPGTDRVE